MLTSIAFFINVNEPVSTCLDFVYLQVGISRKSPNDGLFVDAVFFYLVDDMFVYISATYWSEPFLFFLPLDLSGLEILVQYI